jgi:hypothetical protein
MLFGAVKMAFGCISRKIKRPFLLKGEVELPIRRTTFIDFRAVTSGASRHVPAAFRSCFMAARGPHCELCSSACVHVCTLPILLIFRALLVMPASPWPSSKGRNLHPPLPLVDRVATPPTQQDGSSHCVSARIPAADALQRRGNASVLVQFLYTRCLREGVHPTGVGSVSYTA